MSMLTGKECFEIRDHWHAYGNKLLADMNTREVLLVANALHHGSPTRQALYDWQYRRRRQQQRPENPPPKAA